MTTISRKSEDVAWYSLSAEDATRRLSVVPTQGLSPAQTARLLAEHGPNELPKEPPPSRWAVARGRHPGGAGGRAHRRERAGGEGPGRPGRR
jgi:P-type Ca2+ transporter type 2C